MLTRHWYSILVAFVCLVCLPSLSFGQIRLPAIFQDNMVLQQNTTIKIWGWGDPFKGGKVTLSWHNQPFLIKGDSDSNWAFEVATPAAGGSHSIRIESDGKITEVKNITFGEVWICAGQSNMEWNASHGVKDALEELPHAKNNQIRLFKMEKKGAKTRQDDIVGKWSICDSTSLRQFSAVGYFFGKELARQLNVPIGLIDMAWGGSYIESWIPEELISLYPDAVLSTSKIPQNNHWPRHSGRIFNGMVHPILDFKIAGVLWYQGESNTHYSPAYLQLKELMVDVWRKQSKQEFPFYYVQIAPFTYPSDSTQIQAALVREAQWKATRIPKSGMVVSTDQVDKLNDVHPIYKGVIGRRLANWALVNDYHKTGIVYKSPAYKDKEIKGSKVLITLEDVSSQGLELKGAEAKAFEIAAKDGKFVQANARIIGKNQLEVWADSVREPLYVRFAFSSAPTPNLMDKSGLPVIPFRTDI